MNYNNFIDYHLKHEQIPLTDSQLKMILNDETQKVIAYHSLAKMDTIKDLFGDKDAIILLHESSYNAGHYVTLLKKVDRDGNTYIEVWDSFGDAIEASVNKFKYEQTNYLRNILEKSKELNIIRYYIQNKKKYQLNRQKTQTCGRYSCYRVIHKNLTLSQFNSLLSPINRTMRFDTFITLITDLNVRYN